MYAVLQDSEGKFYCVGVCEHNEERSVVADVNDATMFRISLEYGQFRCEPPQPSKGTWYVHSVEVRLR